MSLPTSSPYIVVGAGIHGLSTAYHLALALQSSGKGSGRDIIVIEKSEVGSGATGIACGVIRNNYFQPAMRELMAHSVDVWESDPENYGYHAVGYMQISPESMHEDVASIFQQQQDIGYDSVFIEGAHECENYMQGVFHDWQAQGTTSVLHEKRGGYANSAKLLAALTNKAKSEGVTIIDGTVVTAIERDSSGSIKSIVTDRGQISTDYLVIAAGPWARNIWAMLEQPETIEILNKETGVVATDVPMWTYWSLQEGTLGVDPAMQQTNSGDMPPVIHLDSDAPLMSDIDGSLITDEPWGIYYKPDFQFGGVQGGAAPFIVDKAAREVQVDPYGPESPEFVVGHDFAHMWVSALAHCQSRFSGTFPSYKDEPSGGIGCFTPDSFPIFDTLAENCFFVADSNHGYKMLGVGKLVAEAICGKKSALLEPFSVSRYAAGQLHPVSNSPFPWS